MDIQTQKKLDYLEETKQLLRAAIEEKGQTINDSDPFRSYVDKVRAITTGGGSAELRYVTFKDDTGTVEYGKKAVAVGDDCADPIVRGVFSTPTKASTAQYNYTFAGWSTTPGGGIDSSALKAVNEDRTVYANFASVLRYYTITYYDSDGVTMLKTESLAYGAMPSYVPSKSGVVFDSWSPAVSAVTGEASYIASWSEKITFSAGTWADIARIAESGQASKHFAVGDTRTIQITWANGDTTDAVFEIIGINHDNLADGSGKAGITVCSKNWLNFMDFFNINVNLYKIGDGWANSEFRTFFNSAVDRLPEEMRQHIKTVKKVSKKAYNDPTTEESDDKLFMPSSTEFTGALFDGLYSYGTQYQGFNTAAKRKRYKQYLTTVETSYSSHATRQATKGYKNRFAVINYVGNYVDSTESANGCCLCFCI